MEAKIGAKIKEWTVVHAIRTPWRGEFDGVFLGTCEGRWMIGREFTGKSMHDGFHESGEWWYSTYFDYDGESESYRWWRALQAYEELARKAGDCWGANFRQRSMEAVEKYLANVEPMDTWDLSAYWCRDQDLTAGATYLLPAHKAKQQLLSYMHGSPAIRDAYRRAEQNRPGSDLDKAFQYVIGAKGDIRVQVDGYTFGLSHDAEYGELRFPRRPHPDRRTA